MSLDCEPSELTPLRQNAYQQQQQLLSDQQPQQYLEPHSALDHLQLSNSSEYMSINNNNHPMGSDSSRVDISEPNSQQAFNPKPNFIMSDTRRILTRIIIDIVILLCGESYIFNLVLFIYFFVVVVSVGFIWM